MEQQFSLHQALSIRCWYFILELWHLLVGMQGAMMTDVIQGSLMIATAIVTFIVSIVMGGGFGNINHTLQSMNEAYLAFPGANGYMPWAYYVSNIVLWSFFLFR